MARIDFIELPVKQYKDSADFFAQAFGWDLTSFGPTYACTLSGDVDLGLQASQSEATQAPLVVIAVDDLEASLAAVTEAGGKITKQPFSFPGGRRFHFLEPGGNELAAWHREAAQQS